MRSSPGTTIASWGWRPTRFLWPAAGVTRSVYLKELYVSESSRKQGAGHLLMSELCRIAHKNGCDRVEWTADIDNPIALNFYATLGVPADSAKRGRAAGWSWCEVTRRCPVAATEG